MIWFDFKTGEPVAPGSCEDGGYPSVEIYYCYNEDAATVLVPDCGDMVCYRCRVILLTRG